MNVPSRNLAKWRKVKSAWTQRHRKNIQPIPPELINKHQGQVAIVLGNGPSLKDYDLTDPFFTENVTFGANAITDLFTPTYYTLTDPHVIDIFPMQILNARTSTFLLGELVWAFWTTWAARKRRLPNSPRYMVRYDRKDRVGAMGKGRIYHGCTVGMVMFNIAFLMGFKYIFVLGIDGYGVRGQKHYYKGEGRKTGNPSNDKFTDDIFRRSLPVFEESDRFVFSLSGRSVHNKVLPVWHEIQNLNSV